MFQFKYNKKRSIVRLGKCTDLGDGGLVGRVQEHGCVVIDVTHPHDHRDCPLLVAGLDGACQLQNIENVNNHCPINAQNN